MSGILHLLSQIIFAPHGECHFENERVADMDRRDYAKEGGRPSNVIVG